MAARASRANEVTFAVPREYRDYIARHQNKQWLWMLCLYVASVYLWCVTLKHTWHPSPLEIIPCAALFSWLYRLSKPWSYQISETRIMLPDLNGSGWPWLWKEVKWDDDVAEIVEWQWGSIPGFLFKMRDEEELLMVYSPEDEEAVRLHVLPLVERYFLPDRHERWAQRLRS